MGVASIIVGGGESNPLIRYVCYMNVYAHVVYVCVLFFVYSDLPLAVGGGGVLPDAISTPGRAARSKFCCSYTLI